jgi:hypothetical protein
LVETKEELSIPDVLYALGVETGRQTQVEMNRVARCLKALGWSRKQVVVGHERRWVYRKASNEG